MFPRRRRSRPRDESGASLLLVTAGMIVVLGAAGVSIDLVWLYVARSEAQRAADSAALAGAMVYITSGCTNHDSGSACSSSTIQTDVKSAAEAAGNQNLVGGVSPLVADADVTFPTDSTANGINPRVTVTVKRTRAHGNAVPLYFMKIFGKATADVSATATAEAYNPGNAGAGAPTVCVSCLKPWIVPNCDPVHTTPTNSVCPGGGNFAYFVDPATGALDHAGVYNGGSSGGVIGLPWALHSNAAPSQYYELDFDGGGGAAYSDNIAICNADNFTCGQTYNLLTGKKVGPTDHGVQVLIHANGDGLNQGQDQICAPSNPNNSASCPSNPTPPFPIIAGANNPLVTAGTISAGSFITESDSIVTVPMYDGHDLCPGKSCGASVGVVGFLQMFITDVNHHGNDDNVNSIILNVWGCGGSTGACGTADGGGGSGPSGQVSGGGASVIPVRLVSN